MRNQLGAAMYSTQHVELPVVPKEDRHAQSLGGGLGSECQLRTCTLAVNLQSQQRGDTGVVVIWEDVPR